MLPKLIAMFAGLGARLAPLSCMFSRACNVAVFICGACVGYSLHGPIRIILKILHFL